MENCNKMAPRFMDLWEKLHISYDDFIRTTQYRHVSGVQKILQQVYDNVDIYLENKENSIGDKSLLESYLDDVDNADVINDKLFSEKDNNIKETINDVINENSDPKEDIKVDEDPLFTVTKKGMEPPKEEQPKEEPPKEEQPKEEQPKDELPKEELPKEEPLKEEAPQVEEIPKEEKEIISVDKNDDTETVDLFFEDVSKMLEKKGIDIDKGNDKYTLFDDAIIEEEGF